MATACFTIVVLATALWCRTATALPNIPTVTYNDATGIILGKRLLSAGLRAGAATRDYAVFWGVPYAKPPVGKLRFKPPVPAPLPVGTLEASAATAPCLQQRRAPEYIKGSEDCLTLQIFTPYLDGPELPVLVYFHGGAFMYGDAPRTGMQYLMDHDLVVVTVDYRLGILGYLSFDDEVLPGNLGMLDQVESLRWVQRNIHLFGGNNRSVTIMGNSAGSASCLLHTMSPLSRGLFHRVIGSSGSPLNPWTQQHSSREKALRVASLANCSANTTAAIVTCLQGKNATDLVALEAKYFQSWQQNPFSPFAPVVDRKAKEPFLPRDPQSILASGKGVADVPLLLGITTEEGLYNAGEFLTNLTLLRELDDQWETVAPQLLHFYDNRVRDNDKPALSRQIRQHYLKNASMTEGTRELVQLMGDRNFVVGVASHALQRASAQSAAVYVYRFGYRGQFSLYNNVQAGTSHADDIQYFLEFSRWSGPFTKPSDVLMHSRLLQMWTSFINTSLPLMQGVSWSPVAKNNSNSALNYLYISGPANMTMVVDKNPGHSSFWRTLTALQDGNHSARVQASPSLLAASLCVASLMVALAS